MDEISEYLQRYGLLIEVPAKEKEEPAAEPDEFQSPYTGCPETESTESESKTSEATEEETTKKGNELH